MVIDVTYAETTSTEPRTELDRQHDRVVREEIEAFRVKAAEYQAGAITEDDFRGYRLRFGCYGQRQPGVQMVRTKVPGGMLTAEQMERLADVSDFCAAGKGHLTTRQNMQFHFVPLEQVADLMHMLHDVGMTSREACFNTVRNVTACPYAGLTRNEVFDVRPYSQRVAFAFLRQELTNSMPRKFKIAFDGCTDSDCTLAAIHDVGAKAVIRDGQRGFRIVVAGGLGPLPVEAKLLDEFLPAERIVNRIEAVLRVFNQYGNRKNRNMARLKFVTRERGFDWLKEQIDKEYADILANGGIPTPTEVPAGFGGYTGKPPVLGTGAQLPVVNNGPSGDKDFDRWLESSVEEQQQTGYAMVIVKVQQGNLTSTQMRQIAKLAREAGDGCLRVTVEQNLVLGYVPLALLPRVHASLVAMGLGEPGAEEIQDIVTCPGAYSCNLALTKSMNLGYALEDMVRGYDEPLLRKLQINVSGCPNSCGQHWTAEVGFYGNARKIEGKEVPHYQMLLGGGYDEQGVMRFGLQVMSLPARHATVALARVLAHYKENYQEGETFRNYVLRHKIEFFKKELLADLAKVTDLNSDIVKDWGDDESFSLQLGRGECAA
ncbi:MAG: nitrite/sulfite reductase, hemoprotein beta-component, ferrodoxin domain protein [Bryobacterales bacterium]|nr:nitrite/sulfite reductase, hemoprotein beta-component, ferrodoxin domain protein [Bryobacterales bacterium]